MSDVFVSYKAEDRKRVRPLVEALQADGYSVWWDEQIGGGAAWRHAIEAELNAAKCVIVVWSKRSVGPEGEFVHDEASRAKERHVYVPVRIENVHLPLGFGETQALPLTGWHGDRADPHYQAVLAAVRRLVGDGVPHGPSVPLSRTAVTRRTAIAGGAVAAAAIAVSGAWMLLRPSSAAASASVAVLPFANLSGDPAQAYFSDGIAEEIRSALARLGGLTVIGRTSSEAVRNDDAQTVARKLHVGNILTGSVRQSPSMIRISAELIDGRTGADRWTQDYDRSPGDVIKIQTDIAENVATALSAALGKAVRAAITVGGTRDPEAQKLLLQAIEAGRTRRQAGTQRAINLLDAAIDLDPNYADAYARKSAYLSYYAGNFAVTVPQVEAYLSTALQAANQAIRTAPNLATAHQALAQYFITELDIARGNAELRRALELAPSNADAISNYAVLQVRLLHPGEALRLADKSLTLDPLDPSSYFRRFLVLFYSRKYAEALSYSKEVERNSPELFGWPEFAGWAAIFSGDLNGAQPYFDRAPPDDFHRLVGEADLLIRTGRRAEVEGKLARLRKVGGDTLNFQYSQVYAQLGDKDRAFAALDRAWKLRDAGLAWIRVDPHLDPLRSDPRFAELVGTMNFPN
jgi:serine/threonine-protein kinase